MFGHIQHRCLIAGINAGVERRTGIERRAVAFVTKSPSYIFCFQAFASKILKRVVETLQSLSFFDYTKRINHSIFSGPFVSLLHIVIENKKSDPLKWIKTNWITWNSSTVPAENNPYPQQPIILRKTKQTLWKSKTKTTAKWKPCLLPSTPHWMNPTC